MKMIKANCGASVPASKSVKMNMGGMVKATAGMKRGPKKASTKVPSAKKGMKASYKDM
jgi:hypothetical protein